MVKFAGFLYLNNVNKSMFMRILADFVLLRPFPNPTCFGDTGPPPIEPPTLKSTDSSKLELWFSVVERRRMVRPAGHASTTPRAEARRSNLRATRLPH